VVASLITSVANDCAPLLVAVSVYCSVSPGLGADRGGRSSALGEIADELGERERAGRPTVVTSLAVSVAGGAPGWHWCTGRRHSTTRCSVRSAQRPPRGRHLDDQTQLLSGADAERARPSAARRCRARPLQLLS